MKIYRFISLVVLGVLLFSVCGLAEASAIDVIKEKIAKSACIILRILQGISGIVAVLMMVLAGLKWMSSDDPESRSDARTRVLYILIGLFLIFITLELVNVLASGLGVLGAADCGMLDTDPELIASIVGIVLRVMVVVCRIVKILSYIFAVIAAILIIFAGFRWMTSDNPETRHSSRNLIAGVVVGVVFVVIAYHIVSGLFATMLAGVGVPPAIIPYFFNCDAVFTAFDAAYPGEACTCDATTDFCDPNCPCDLDCVIQPARKVICRLFRVLQAIAGVLAALVIMTSGVTWFTSGDIEKKSSAKGMIISAVLGLILVVVSLQLVNSIIIGMSAGDFDWDCGTLVAPGEVTDITDPIRNAICVIIRTVQLIVGLIVVLIITYSALQFASSGDPGERAAARSRAIYAIIGLIAILLATQLINAILTGMGLDDYDCVVAASTTATLTGNINNALCVLLKTLQMAAVIIAAIILVLVGMEWMSSDDPEGRAAAKKKAAGVVIALIIIVIAIQLVDTLAEEILGIDVECPDTVFGLGDIKHPLCIILRSLQGIIAIVAALLLVLVGVQWMTSHDPQARTRAKVMAGRIVVGFVVAYIAVQLVNGLVSGIDASINCGLPRYDEPSNILAADIRAIVCLVLRVLELVALIVAALVLVFSGIQFMSSDSSESRSKAKSMAIHAIIGLIIVVTATELIFAMADPFIPGVYCDYDYEGLERDHYQLVYRIQRVGCIIYQVARLAGFFCATIVLLISGLVWISSDSAEGRSMAKRMILHVIIGLVILLLALQLIIALIGLPADPLSLDITSCSVEGDLPEDIRLLGCMIIKILEYFAIVVAMVVLILAGLLYMAADSPQARSRIKIVVGAIIVGIAVVIVAVHLVNAIISQVGVDDMDCSGVDIDEDVRRGVEAIGCSLIRMIQLVCGIAATVIIILAGIQWMVSDDPETRNNARSWIIVVAIGLIIILVGMHFVNALITTDSNIFDIADISC